MSDGFRVDPAALAAHARRLEELAARVQRAGDAAQPLDPGAYGVIGQVFTVVASGAARSGSAAVAALGRRTAELGTEVRAAAEEYRRTERQNAAGFARGPR